MNKIKAFLRFITLFLTFFTEGALAQTYGLQVLNGTQIVIQSGITVTVANNLGTKIDGANSGINNNGTLVVEGSFLNQNSAVVQNGVYKIGGAFTNTGSFSGTTVELNGTNASTISSTSAFNNLTINKGVSNPIVNLASGLSINGILNFTSGYLQTNAFDLNMGSAGTITGFDDTKFIITNGNNALSQVVGSTSKTFPVGTTTSSYTPLSIRQVGTALRLAVRVRDNVFQNPTILTGGPPSFATGVVNKTWVVSEPDAAVTKSLDFVAQWHQNTELGGFNRALCVISQWKTGTTWNVPYSPTGPSTGGPNYYTRTKIGISSVGYFAVGSSSAVIPITLLDFTATAQDKSALLGWTTTEEYGVSNFDIEKSLDGKNFVKIAEVKAHNTPSVYSTVDDHFSQSSYYRLKINNLDGTSTFSKIQYLEKNAGMGIKIRHDTEGGVWIETNDKIESVHVINRIGQVVKTTKDRQFFINDFPEGIYLVVVKTSNGTASEKVFVF